MIHRIYSDYVRQNSHTLFVFPNDETDGVHLMITFGDGIIRHEVVLTADNARMLAHFLQQHANRTKP